MATSDAAARKIRHFYKLPDENYKKRLPKVLLCWKKKRDVRIKIVINGII